MYLFNIFDLPHVPLSMCTVYSSIQLEKGVCHHFLKPLTIVRLGGSGFFAIQSPDASGGTGGRTGYILQEIAIRIAATQTVVPKSVDSAHVITLGPEGSGHCESQAVPVKFPEAIRTRCRQRR